MLCTGAIDKRAPLAIGAKNMHSDWIVLFKPFTCERRYQEPAQG
jgi:hypothetical protein